MECDRTGQSESERCRAQSDTLRATASGCEREDDSGKRQQNRENEQVAAWRGRPQFRRHFASPPSGLVHASGSNVTRPLSSESRKMSATASALAAKATTIPVMTMACGTGSKRKPA